MAKQTDPPESETPATPTQAPDPWAILNKLADALSAAKTSPKAQSDEAVMARVMEMVERVAGAQLQGMQILSTEARRSNRPSNEIIPGISVFNRRGVLLDPNDPGPHKPKLKCLMMIPWLVEWESITREEAELLNLLEPGEYIYLRPDRSRVKMGVKIDYKMDGVTPSRLIMNHITDDGAPGSAFNRDNYTLNGGLVDMLRIILKQHSPAVRAAAAAVLSDEEEEALIECGQLTISQ